MLSIVKEWLDTFAPRTRPNYRKSTMLFLEFFKSQDIHHITFTAVQQWRRSLPEHLPGLRGHLAAIKSLLHYLYNQGYTSTNFGRCLKLPRQSPIRVERNMNKQQVLESIAACSGNNRLLLTLLYYLGARVSEVIRIERHDIKIIPNGLEFKLLGKGNKVRYVKLTNNVSDYVKSQLRDYPKYLFPGRKGHITRKCAWYRVKRAVKNILPRASPHYYRHAMATTALQAGCDIATISKVLGHSSIATTSLYLHARENGACDFL